jgi:hypothetical protein
MKSKTRQAGRIRIGKTIFWLAVVGLGISMSWEYLYSTFFEA